MRPEDIQNQDFLVGLRGYDKDEVRAFLAQVAAEHASLQAELEQARSAKGAEAPRAATAAPPRAEITDDFENLGASVAAIVRAAKESAIEITAEAEARAEALREEADAIRREAQESSAEMRRRASAEADDLRSAAQRAVDEARAQAEAVVRESTDRVRQIELEHEARMNNRAEEVARREAATRARLNEAAEELELAIEALNEPGASTPARAEREAPSDGEHGQPEEHGEHGDADLG